MARQLRFEVLHQRQMFAADWNNAANYLDVNDSGVVTPLDALLIINDLNDHGARVLGAKSTVATPAWIDVNGDNAISPVDALLVINALSTYRQPPDISFENSTPDAPGSSFIGRTTPNAKVVIEQLAAVLPIRLELTANAEGEVSGIDISSLGMLATAKVIDPLGRSTSKRVEFIQGAASARVINLTDDAPKIGEVAPDFSLPNQNDEHVSLSDTLSRGTVVLYFYPKDNTPKCTLQAQDLRKRSTEIASLGATILGVSVDPVDSHLEFSNQYDLNFDILSDVNRNVSTDYGVLTELNGKSIALRTTFIVGSDGIIKEIFQDVDVDAHTERVIAALRQLRP